MCKGGGHSHIENGWQSSITALLESPYSLDQDANVQVSVQLNFLVSKKPVGSFYGVIFKKMGSSAIILAHMHTLKICKCYFMSSDLILFSLSFIHFLFNYVWASYLNV